MPPFHDASRGALDFRVLLSNDAVYRFQCLASQQLRVVFAHIREFRGLDSFQLRVERSGAVVDGQDVIGNVLIANDILTAEIDAMPIKSTIFLVEGRPDPVFNEADSPLDLPSPMTQHEDASFALAMEDYDQCNDRDIDRWRKAHVSRIESSGTSVINISPLEIEHNTRISHHDLMLHAALQLTENALVIQKGLRALYLHLRSHQESKEIALSVLKLIRSTDRRPIFLDRGVDIVMQGYVDCGKWGALWRTKKRSWAVLYDTTMAFFSSPECARKYMFALSNERRHEFNQDVEIGKRIQRDYAPHTEYHLSGWSVRPGAPHCERNTFALFDETGTLRQVLDVSTPAETETWVRAISGQAQQHLVRLQAKLTSATAVDFIQALGLQDATPLKLRVPLKWLHVQLEAQDDKSRSRRLNCCNFSQAVKDIQRDVLRINGHVHASSCFEDMLSELAIELMQHTSQQTKTSEMDAMAFARELLIHSSRTYGGGDVLDAVHSLLHSTHFCICPEMSHVAPVDVEIQLIDGKTVVEIEMTMVFKLIPIGSDDAIGRIVGTSIQRMVCDITDNLDVDGDILIAIEPMAK
ncbi:hypothetical protein LEN26_010094 [Aphanomyces euteiches]|nr:hypothetical protein AeMF1_018915 [Aphanomyces euteiches]KAH9122794.1 hypothetical protein LEN26_010094 [Aphanomyces euteiches]KAH9189043.1 hypothetical protein AeNC1_008986 [Aphanomyces euteiches]